MTAPLVSVTTPTFNRPHKHEGLYKTFCDQDYEPRELVVLDGSKEPSPFFSTLKDDRVRYFHEPEPPREGGVTRIGAVRNRLTQLAKGEILASFDDDDHYAKDFVSENVRRLGDADLAKLVVWRILHGEDIYLWDQRIIGGPAYAIRGDVVEPTDTNDMSPEEATAFRDAWQLGFMWSAVFRKSVALEIPFPEEGTEDVPWMRALVEAGKKIVFVADAPHLALHAVEPNPAHAEGGSPHFPQVKLRAAAAKRMMGAGIAQMNELPQGEKIQIEPGRTYRVLAAIKNSHSAKSIETRAAHWGMRLTESIDNADPAHYGVQAPPDGYRLIDFIGTGDKPVVLPWAAPKMMQVIGEKSRVVKAWIGAGSPADHDDAFVLRVFVGAGAAEQMSAEDAAVERYDPKRYNGKPPHVCTVASATTIAQQLPGAPWRYVGTVTSTTGMRESAAKVQTPTAAKNIPVWHAGDGSIVTQCPYSGQLFHFQNGVAVGAGAPRGIFKSKRLGADRQLGAGDFNSDASDPGFAASWQTINVQLQAEGALPTDILNAKNQFDSAFATFGQQQWGGDALASAQQFVWQNQTVAGAVGMVGGLTSAATMVGGPADTTAPILSAFTGVLMGALVTTGVATAGVGAAITAGVGALLTIMQSAGLFGPTGGTDICGLKVEYAPDWIVSECNAFYGTRAAPGSPEWRNFPSPSNANDLGWFTDQTHSWITGSSSEGRPSTGQISGGSITGGAWFPDGSVVWNGPLAGETLTIYALGAESYRLIDLCFTNYRHLECEQQSLPVAAALAGALTPEQSAAVVSFCKAFFTAWKLNAAYSINGMKAADDSAVLVHALRFWNRAHLPGAGFALQPATSGQIGRGDACGVVSVLYEQIVAFAALGTVQSTGSDLWSASNTTGIVQPGGTALHLNTGPLKSVAIVGTTLGSTKKPEGSGGWSLFWTLAGVSAAAAAGVGYYSYREGIGYGQAWKNVLRGTAEQTARSGKLLIDAAPHKLLLKR